MRSYLGRTSPNPMTAVFSRKDQIETEEQREDCQEKPEAEMADGLQPWNATPPGHRQELGEAWNGDSLQASERTQPCPRREVRLQASRTIRKSTWAVSSPPSLWDFAMAALGN